MKKIRATLSLKKETLAQLTASELDHVAGGAPTTTHETIRCSRVQGSCITCAATNCH